MKRILMTTGVALLALATVAGAQSFSFNSNLTVGSRGADVVALQTWLIANGYSIPSIESGAAAKGYFGTQTKSAVMKYQAANGIPNTGFVGPLTRAALNAGGVVAGGTTGGTGMVTCPVGYTCTPTPGTGTGTGTGTVTAPSGITTPGIPGTLSVSLQGSPSGASLDKGETEDVVRYKLQSTASDMLVTSIAIDVDARLWLYASGISVKDDNGTVIASKTGLTSSDFSELTVGTSYRLLIPVNYVVPKSSNRNLTIALTMLPISDRSSTSITIGQVQVRSVDGTGVTDTQTLGDDRTFSFTGSNTGDIVLTVNSASPLKRLVQISNSAETKDVVMSVFDLKNQNRSSTLRTLKFYVKTDGTSVSTLFNQFKVRVGGTTYTADSITTSGNGNTTSSSTVTFTNLSVPLPADTYVSVTFLADVAKPASTGSLDGKSASSTLLANSANIVAEDATYNTVNVSATTLVGSDAIFSAASAVLSSKSLTVSGPSSSNVSTTVSRDLTLNFTLTAGDSTLYVSGLPGIALATSTNISGIASSSLTAVTTPGSEVPGDVTTGATPFYVIPPGQSRQFKFTGVLRDTYGAGARYFSITGIKYGTSATDNTTLTANQINYGLSDLRVDTSF